jgi:hypothetical protein
VLATCKAAARCVFYALLACPKPARRGERRANAPRSRKLSEFGAFPRDDDDLTFNSRHEVLRSAFQYQISFFDGFFSSHERSIAIVLCDDIKL